MKDKSKVQFNKVWKIFKMEMFMRQKMILIWSLALIAIMLLYMLLFPSVKEMALEKMAAMPEELLAFFGMSGEDDFSNFNQYFASIFQIVLIVLSAYAASTSASILHDEESNGTIEFLNACNVSRGEIYLAKVITIFVNFIIILICTTLAVLISGFSVALDTIDPQAIAATLWLSSLTIFSFVAIGFLVATLVKKSIKAANIALATMFGIYIIGYLSNIGPEFLSHLQWLSPFEFLSSGEIMTTTIGIGTNSLDVMAIIFPILIIFGLLISGYYLYQKKDL